ncbi:MAG TPA: hypothetical protein VH369_22275 [Bryobacteraceae bacterium]|jgi:hypothetical protein
MTTLRPDAALTRKTAATIRHRPLVIELHDRYLEIRRASTRIAYPLSYEALYRYAAQLAADRARAERKNRRKERAA